MVRALAAAPAPAVDLGGELERHERDAIPLVGDDGAEVVRRPRPAARRRHLAIVEQPHRRRVVALTIDDGMKRRDHGPPGRPVYQAPWRLPAARRPVVAARGFAAFDTQAGEFLP